MGACFGIASRHFSEAVERSKSQHDSSDVSFVLRVLLNSTIHICTFGDEKNSVVHVISA